ncbi:MAG: response regulator transcription factor [Dehalococcoidia bacterium]|nr:response regulator transcription factor [Dehalococcoidia bacterium]
MSTVDILIISVDDETVNLLLASVPAQVWRIHCASSRNQAIDMMSKRSFALIIFDAETPDIDGFEFDNLIREYSDTPMVVLGAKSEISYKVKFLNKGAADYIIKPFSPEELIARIRVLFRRSKPNSDSLVPTSVNYGDLKIKFSAGQVIVNNKEIMLTPIEYNLLKELVLNEGKVLTYKYLLKKIWGSEYETERQYVHVYIRRLRSKFQCGCRIFKKYIISIPRIGYQFKHISPADMRRHNS